MGALAWATCTLLALCACWPHLAAAQMESPLKGQGVPSLNTTQVFLSIRLERLLDVDIVKFRHENVATYWLSWADPGAEAAIRERTAAAANETAACRRPCSNRVADVRCCDGIFLPSLYFYNADAFPEDREIGYSIDTTASGAVVWETTVHGLYYQPLSMRNFPQDIFNLEMQLTLTDTSRLVANHPGLQLVPSAASLEGVHLSRRKRDLTNGWYWFYLHANGDAGFKLYRLNRTAWYQDRMAIAPHAGDVAPFTALNTSTAGLLDDTVQMAVFRFMAFSSSWNGQLNSNMPVYGVAMLSLIIFWIPEDELAARIELCAALFLTLIAIQFVVSDKAVAHNDYLTAPQITIVMTGGYILFIACESVACYYIIKRNSLQQRRQDMWQAAKERSMQRRAARAAAAAASAQDGCDEEEEVVKPLELHEMEGSELPAADSQLCEEPAAQPEKKTCGCLHRKTGARMVQVQLPPRSDNYNAFVAWMVNRVCMVFYVVSYILAAVLNGILRRYGFPLRSPDALLSFSELSSCQMPGVLPGLADPCPTASLGISEL